MWTRQDFGQRLRAELKRLGVAARHLAAVIGRSERQIPFYLEGRNVPTPEGLRQIASALRVPMDYLWPEQGDELVIHRARLRAVTRSAEVLAQRLGLDPGQVRTLGRVYDALGRVDTALEAIAKPPDTRFHPIEVLNASTGARVTFVTLELPLWVQDPRGFYDPDQNAVFAFDFGNHAGPTFVRTEPGGRVLLTQDPHDTAGTHLATIALAPSLRLPAAASLP